MLSVCGSHRGGLPQLLHLPRGQLDPLGELGVLISKDEVKLHPRWSKETLVYYLPFTMFQILTGGWRVIPIPKDFKSILKLPHPAPLSLIHWVRGGMTDIKPFNKMKHSDEPARAS